MANQEWSVGTLPPRRFGSVETVLSRIGKPAPIMTAEQVIVPEERQLISMWDESAASCLTSCTEQFQIRKQIWYCLTQHTETNALASFLPQHDEYVVVLMAGFLKIAQAISRTMSDTAVQEFLGLNNGNGPGAENIDTLITIAFRWLVYHELGHIKNGHLHILDRQHATSFERVAQQGAEDYNLTRQTLEMDADFFAFGQIFKEVLGKQYYRLFSAATISPLTSVKSIAIAIFTVLRCFDAPKVWTGDNTFTFTHPPTSFRMLKLGSWGLCFLPKLEQPIISMDEWCDVSLRALYLTDNALGVLDGFSDEDIQTFYRPLELGRYTERLLRRWAKIRLALEPHLLGGVLAAAQEEPE